MSKEFFLPHGTLQFPVFLPDATRGVVRGVDTQDLEQEGLTALVMNAYHLMQNPGSTTIKALGGLHRMTGWNKPIITDSGGFQIYSLIRQNPKYGRLTDKGAVFQTDRSERKFNLTPEKSIQLQFSYGADVMVCLDDCTHVDDSPAEQERSVERTLRWAKRCKQEFERLSQEKRFTDDAQPKLFAVIQGGASLDLRKRCAEALLEIGFDGYGYGGWPLDGNGKLLVEMFSYCRDLIPAEFPMHALGVGHPPNIVESYGLGYDIFDSAMPTRDARNGRLYTFRKADPRLQEEDASEWFGYVYAYDKKHTKADEPISPFCDCACCRRYSLGYLHHLFDIKDTLALRLATLHNLRFMMQLMTLLQAEN